MNWNLIKLKLKRIFWYQSLGNKYWWLFVAIILVVISILILVGESLNRAATVIQQPETIGNYFGKVVHGFNSTK